MRTKNNFFFFLHRDILYLVKKGNNFRLTKEMFMSAGIHDTLKKIHTKPFTCSIHGTSIELALNDQLWDDGSYLFLGYNTKKPQQIIIAGHPANLHIEIIPEDAPQRKNPFSLSQKEGQDTIVWYENALTTLSAAYDFLKEFEEKQSFILNGTLNSEIEKYYDHEKFVEQLDFFSQILKNHTFTFAKKTELLKPVFISIKQILENCHIPDNLKYEESFFFQNIIELQKHVQVIIEETLKTKEDIIPDFKSLARHLADTLKIIHNNHQNVIQSRKLSQTNKEINTIEKTCYELNQILSEKKELQQAMPHIEYELALCKNVWNNSAIDWQTRLNAATHAVERISDAIDLAESTAIENKKQYAIIPDLSRFTIEINKQIKELDKTGFKAIASPIADRFLPNINENRKSTGLNKIVRQDFVDNMKIDSLYIVVTENNGQNTTTLHLYLTNTYTQHFLYVLILNNKIFKMKLTEQKTPFLLI